MRDVDVSSDDWSDPTRERRDSEDEVLVGIGDAPIFECACFFVADVAW